MSGAGWLLAQRVFVRGLLVPFISILLGPDSLGVTSSTVGLSKFSYEFEGLLELMSLY